MSNKVSVVLPTYNQAEYLPEALDSIFAQTYPYYKVVVVNDGSTDDTARVLSHYQQKHNFTVVNQKNQGLPRALNTGFAHTRGDYLTWTSSDNIMLPDMLSTLVQALDEDPTVGLVYADFYLTDDSGQDLGRFETVDYDPHWLLYTNLVHCCFLYRRECMERVGGYHPKFIYCEDYEYWIRISQHFSMKRVSQALYRYRLHKASMTGKMERGVARDMGWVKFAVHIRRRMPIRWFLHKLKRWWAYLTPTDHPVVQERRAWLRAIAQGDYG